MPLWIQPILVLQVLLQNKPCIVMVIIFVVIPLLTGNVLFHVRVQAERAAGVPTVFQTKPVNPQATRTNPTTATTTGVHMPSGYGTAANRANTKRR
jgi:hypothetical protein